MAPRGRIVQRRHVVRLYFDFVSPYSWLGLMRARPFGERHDVDWRLRPVVYSALLDATGLIGPAETPAKRAYTFQDIRRCAHRAGLRLVGPPAHPFRSVEALRAVCLVQDRPEALAVACRLADACWGEGRALTEPSLLETLVAEAGADADRFAERVAAPRIKGLLKSNTDEAIAGGIFGVPTFVYRGELFWGHDRLDHLADRLRGELPDDRGEFADRMLARPRGADRKRFRHGKV